MSPESAADEADALKGRGGSTRGAVTGQAPGLVRGQRAGQLHEGPPRNLGAPIHSVAKEPAGPKPAQTKAQAHGRTSVATRGSEKTTRPHGNPEAKATKRRGTVDGES